MLIKLNEKAHSTVDLNTTEIMDHAWPPRGSNRYVSHWTSELTLVGTCSSSSDSSSSSR